MKMYLIRAFVLFLFVVFSWNVQQAALLEDGGGVTLIVPKKDATTYEITIPDLYLTNEHLNMPFKVSLFQNNKEIASRIVETITVPITISSLPISKGEYILVIQADNFEVKRPIIIKY